MKRILSLLLLVALSLSLFSCGGGNDDDLTRNEDGLISYSESGLYFALPDEMTRRNVSYADVCYGDGDAQFFVFFYSRDSLLTDCYMDKDSTVQQYAEWCIDFDMCTELTEEYDAEAKRIRYTFVAEDTYYIAIVMRNYDSLIHVTMCCPYDMKATYEPKFDAWEKYVALMYPDAAGT